MEPKHFIRDLEAEFEDEEYYFNAVKLKPELENLYTAILEVETPDPIEESPESTLRKYCEDNAIDPDSNPADCLKAIDDVHHGEALRQAWELLIGNERKKSKKHVLWLCGTASAGKSYFIRRLS